MVDRVHYRWHNHYRTRSNQIRKVKTPGGRVVVQRLAKKTNAVICGECKKQLPGLKVARPPANIRAPRHTRRVRRAYGGNLCGRCLEYRIVRSFIVREHTILKRMTDEIKQADAKGEKSAKKEKKEDKSAKKLAKSKKESPKQLIV